MRHLLFLALLWAINGSAQGTADNLPAGFTKQVDVVYKQVNGWEGKMDIYLPPKKETPSPVIFLIHGGAWRHGSKENLSGFGAYFSLGFAVVNIGYRLSSQGAAPAAAEDVRCAMFYMIHKADSFNIDRNRIVFAGSSAGGHLALLAGLTGNKSPFDKDCQPSDSFHVAAVIAQYAPTQLYEMDIDGETRVLDDDAVREWFGEKRNDTAFAKMLSPVTWVADDNPPVFLVHGDADMRVPYHQSVILADKLRETGVKNIFLTVPGGGHGRFPKDEHDKIRAQMLDFLKENVLH